ncbi:hypothetical protein DVH05_027595 [Phytophthora capsici]|nr:hypothetical protein DVH05_027595 [Phytophthora capsici]
MNGDELFRGRLNGKDQVPPGKRSFGFYFQGLYHDQPDDAPRLKTEFRTVQRRLLDELDDVEDERDDTVEGDDILQVLLRGNRPRAGRRESSNQVTEDQLPHFVR